MAPHQAFPNLPRTAVLTVSFGSEDVLGAFLESLPSASTRPVAVVVADNRAEAAGPVATMARSAGATYIPLANNAGYGGAMNAAAKTLPASIEWLLISNPDVILKEGSIDALVAAGDSDPLIGAVGPAILTSVGQLYPSARSVPSLRTGIGHALFGNLWVANPWTRAYRMEAEEAARRRDAGWLSGACVLVRRSLFDSLDGFDPNFFMYFEDVDLGYRIGKAGYRNVYEPIAIATHTGAHSTMTESARMIEAHHQSARRFLDKRYPGVALWPVRAAIAAGLKLRSALVSRRVGR